MTTSDNVFEEVLSNVVSVLLDADREKVLETSIPCNFKEMDPQLITASYQKFTAENNKDDSADTVETTNIIEKAQKKEYKTAYDFYHDVRLAASILINDLELGSEKYVTVDSFYKLASELFLRECYRLNIHIKELKEKKEAAWKDVEESGLEEMLDADFEKICFSYSVGHSESYVILTQNNIPLFSSLNSRSALDEREVVLPDPVASTTVIPSSISEVPSTLSDVSPTSTRYPNSNGPQTQILSRFLHPNWYSLPTSKWLETSDLQSFAPLIDEQTIVVSSADKGRLWLEHIGMKKLAEWNKVQDVDENISTQVEEVQDEVMKDSGDQETEKSVEETDYTLTPEDYFNLYEWNGYNFIEDEELEAYENGTEQEYLNGKLQQLYDLRQERLQKGNKVPSENEQNTYYSCFRILKDIISIGQAVPDIKHSNLLPIEQMIYTGTLPVPQQNPVSSGYKKKYQKKR